MIHHLNAVIKFCSCFAAEQLLMKFQVCFMGQVGINFNFIVI